VVAEAEPVDGFHAFDEQAEAAPAPDFLVACAGDVGGHVVESVDENDGAADVIGADDGLKGEPLGDARGGQADLVEGLAAGDVRYGAGVDRGEGIGLRVAVEDESFDRHVTEDEAEDPVIRPDEVLPLVADGQKASAGLVVIVDADEVYCSRGIVPPDTVEDEGGAYDVVGRYFVADVHDAQFGVGGEKMRLEAGEVKIGAAEIGGEGEQRGGHGRWVVGRRYGSWVVFKIRRSLVRWAANRSARQRRSDCPAR